MPSREATGSIFTVFGLTQLEMSWKNEVTIDFTIIPDEEIVEPSIITPILQAVQGLQLFKLLNCIFFKNKKNKKQTKSTISPAVLRVKGEVRYTNSTKKSAGMESEP